MWLKKLKHKKPQFILAGVILFVSALIFSASLGFTVEINRFAEDYYNREDMPDLFVFSNDERSPDAIREALPEAELKLLTGVQLTESVGQNGEKIVGLFSVFPLEDYADIPWDFYPREGKSRGPESGEIWIPRVWADLRGIVINDTLTMQNGLPFRVSALYHSALNPSAMSSSYFQFIIHPDDMPLLAGLPYAAILSLYNAGDPEEAQEAATAALQGHQGTIFNNRQGASETFAVISIVLGGIGILSAVLIFIVAVIVIRFMLRANLMKEYRSIGVYKSQGFSNRRIRGFYLNCYMAVGGLSMLLGVLAGLPATAALDQMAIQYVGDFSFSPLIAQLAMLSLLFLFAVLVLNVFLATRPIKKITPVDALRIGMRSTKAKFKRSLIPNASSPLSMAVNDIAKHKGYSVMIALILCVSFYLVLFSLSTRITTEELDVNTDIWFSMPKTDFYVTGRINDDVTERLASDPRVKKLVISEDLFKTPVTADSKYEYSGRVTALFYNDFSSLPYAEGRAPEAANEICVSSVLLGNLDLRVGEYLSLTLGDKKAAFLITGAYHSMMNGGTTVQLLADSQTAHGLEFVPGILMVSLNQDTAPDALINELNRDYGGITAAETLEMIHDATQGIKDMIVPVTLILIIVFTVFSVLNISNLLLQNHADNRKQYGVLKALGFSTGYITARNTWRIFLLSVIAAGAGLLLHLLFSKGLFAGALMMDALDLALPQTLMLLGGLLALLMAVTLLFCVPIRKITPLELMEE